MRTIKKIDNVRGFVYLEDYTLKLIDNYLFELEDKLLEIENILNSYIPVNKEMKEALNKIERVLRK